MEYVYPDGMFFLAEIENGAVVSIVILAFIVSDKEV